MNCLGAGLASDATKGQVVNCNEFFCVMPLLNNKVVLRNRA